MYVLHMTWRKLFARICLMMLMILFIIDMPSYGKNLLPNGSFEAGLGRWLGWETINGQRDSTLNKYRPEAVSSETAHHGIMSLYLPNHPGFICSEFIASGYSLD